MTHAIISAGDYGIYDEDGEISNDDSLSFADPSPDAAAAAADAVKKSFRLRVKKHQSELLESESEFEDFRDIFKKVLHTLSNIETNLESAKGDFRKARHVAPEFIHGVEFRDAMQMRPSIRIKTFGMLDKRQEVPVPAAQVLSGDLFHVCRSATSAESRSRSADTFPRQPISARPLCDRQ